MLHIDLGISVVGGSNKKDSYFVHITRPDVINRIKKHSTIDAWTREFLLKKINEYPDNALAYFIQNINQIVITALERRSKTIEEQYVDLKSIKEESSSKAPVIANSSSESSNRTHADEEREDLFKRPSS